MLKQISNSQAKGPVATATQTAMSLDSPCSQDQEKLRKTIDYDILPEMELRLHSLIKEINQCLDDLVKIKDEIPDEEDEKETEVEGQDERDIVERINALQAECKQLEANVADGKKTKDKYKNACKWFDSEINEHIEKFGTLFLLNTVAPYQGVSMENQSIEAEQIAT